MIKIWRKTNKFKLVYGLSSEEFSCNCKNEFCKSSFATEELLNAYEKFRVLIGKPQTVNCGHRCHAHNYIEGGSDRSQHLLGNAIDLSKIGLAYLTDEEIEHAAKISGFTYVIIYKNFVHLDCRKEGSIL